jgi:hypothetical protein
MPKKKKQSLHPNVVMFAVAGALVAISVAGSATFATGGSSNASANPYRAVEQRQMQGQDNMHSSAREVSPATLRKIIATKRRVEATAKLLTRLDSRIATLEKSVGSAVGENVQTLVETINSLKEKREKVQQKYDSLLEMLDGLEG